LVLAKNGSIYALTRETARPRIVFDQGEPGSSREEITGDSFSMELSGDAYNCHARGGYIGGGNVKVES
jgi:hypothetical protein